jgi:hypothetical protein
MALEIFLNKPADEYKLFNLVSQEISNNFSFYYGQKIYLHISKADNHQSAIDEIKIFAEYQEFGEYLYIEREKEGCILIKPDNDSIRMMLDGEFYFTEVRIKMDDIKITFEKSCSRLPSARKSNMSTIEVMQAFGHIKESLLQAKGNKAS